jgi:diguanylate cyclase (GGDEF)-like protein
MSVLVRWLPAAVRRPSGVVESMRWLYLLTAILSLLLSLPAPLAAANNVTLPLALSSSVALIGSWIAGYRRRGSSILLDIFDALAMSAFALACPAPAAVFTFVFAALWYRSLYGSVARAMVTCAIYSAGICAVLPMWQLVPNGFPAPEAAMLVGTTPAMFLVSMVGRMLGASLFVREESARRDAALASTGTAMLVARDRAEIIDLGARGATAICAATPGLRSIGVFRDRDGATLTFPNGSFAQVPTVIPDHVVALAADGRPDSVRDQEFLNDLAGVPCVWQLIPAPEAGSDGYVLLGAPKRVPSEAVLAMTTLLNQVTFAVRNWEVRENLTLQARTDVLTGLANRAAFTAALEQAGEPVAVLFIDLDDFKAVNDGLGHAAGDKLLREVADRLTAAGGADAVTARLGGDEFALMVAGLAADEVDRLAERVVTAIREPVQVAGTHALVGASVGIADGQADADLLLRRADQAMYAAKVAGKNQVRRYDMRDRQLLTSA